MPKPKNRPRKGSVAEAVAAERKRVARKLRRLADRSVTHVWYFPAAQLWLLADDIERGRR